MQQVMMMAPFSPPQIPLVQVQVQAGPPSAGLIPGGFQSVLLQALEGVQAPGSPYIPNPGGGAPGVSVPLGGPLSLVSLLVGRSLGQAAGLPEPAPDPAIPMPDVSGQAAGSEVTPDTAEGQASEDALQGLIGWLMALAQGADPQAPPLFLRDPSASVPLPMAQVEAALAGLAEDPQLEAFVQQVLERLKAGPAEQLKQLAPTTAGPTFSDLVELIAAKAEAMGARPTAPVTAQTSPAGDSSPDLPELPEAPVVTNLAEQQAALLSDGDGSANPERFGLKSESVAEGVDIRQRVVQAEQVLRQVTRTVKLMVDGGRSELRLTLHPEHLGTVAVKLVVTEGVVQATLNARDPGVRQVLQANLDQLRQRFVDQGMKVDQVDVAIGGESSFSQFDHPQQREAWQGRHTQWQRRHPWRQEPEPQLPEPGPSLRSASGWYPGRIGARINSLA